MNTKNIIIVGLTIILVAVILSGKPLSFGAFAPISVPAGGTGWGAFESGTYLTGNGTGKLSTSTCAQITGSADLCDGSDDGAGGAVFGKTWELASGILSPTTTVPIAIQTNSTSTFSGDLYGKLISASYFHATSSATTTLSGAVSVGRVADATSFFATSSVATSTFMGGINYQSQVMYPYSFGGLAFASSTLAYIGAFGAAGTTTINMGNFPTDIELLNVYCKTDTGTAYVEIGDGTATSTALQCTTSGASMVATVNFSARDNFWVGIGTNANAPNIITVSPKLRTE